MSAQIIVRTALENALRHKLVNGIAAAAATTIIFSAAAALALQGPRTASPPAQKRAVAAVAFLMPMPKPALPNVAKMPVVRVPSVFQREQAMSYAQLMARWNPLIIKAAKRFAVPANWIREVMRIESGGRTMMAENRPIVSSQGALGLMQIQSGTYAEMRAQYRLGSDPFDPHDNIFAGAAYLRWLKGKYGYPVMFEAYDDGPGHLEQRIAGGKVLPDETLNYVKVVRTRLGDPPPVLVKVSTGSANATAQPSLPNARPIPLGAIGAFTRPNGTKLYLDCTLVTQIRAPLVDEYAPAVQSVIVAGNLHQGVQESEEAARQVVRSHGGQV